MSKSGKIKKAAKAQNLKRKKEERQNKKNHSTGIFVGLAVAVGIIIAAIVVWDKYHRETALVVGNDKIYKDEVMYYVFQKESENSFMDSFYSQIYGTGYWESDDGSGLMTNSEAEKLVIQDDAIEDLILEKEAGKAGLSLTDEEIKAADEDAQKIYEQITGSERSENGITLNKLKKMAEREALGDKFKQYKIDGYDIDDDGIRSGVDKDEYRQYDIQYYSVSYMDFDSDDKDAELSEDEVKKLTEEMEKLKDRAGSGEDFAALIGENDESKIEFSGEEAEGICKADTDFSDTLTSVIYAMKNDEISDVIKDEDSGSLYLIKMINNNSDEAYEDEVKSRISSEETSRFEDEYADNILPNYNIDYKEEVWKKISLGRTFSLGQQ